MAREFVARKGLIVSGSTLASGSITATTYYGDGSNLTGISGTTINNNTNDYLVTATGTANTLNGEANLRFSGTVLSTTSSIAVRGTDNDQNTKVFHVQTANGTSIMDFRNDNYAFFGCGQGGGNASGFIFRYRSPSYTQFVGYTYGNGTAAYQPIYLDTDQIGRGKGIFVNYTTGSAPASTEFAVKGTGATSSTYNARFQNSSGTELLAIRDDGNVGIGTTSPDEKLGISFSNNTFGVAQRITNTNTGANSLAYLGFTTGVSGSAGSFYVGQTVTGQASLYNSANSSMTFYTNGSDRMNISPTGRVSIGTNSASAKTQIKGEGTTSGTSALLVENSTPSTLFEVKDDGELNISTTKYPNNGVLTNNGGIVQEVIGWTGMININTAPPITIDVQNGIIVNVI